jgi:hypothetical protein
MLGVVHSSIGCHAQPFCIDCIFRKDGYADTGPNVQRFITQFEWFAK